MGKLRTGDAEAAPLHDIRQAFGGALDGGVGPRPPIHVGGDGVFVLILVGEVEEEEVHACFLFFVVWLEEIGG